MGRHEDVESVMEAAAGPLVWHDQDRAVGHVDGRRVTLVKYYSKGGRGYRLTGIKIRADLQGRGVDLLIDETSLGRSGRKAELVVTGDAAFDEAMQVWGRPEEACRRALSPEMRRYLVETFDQRWPYVTVEDGQVQMSRTVLHDTRGVIITPPEVADTARHVCDLAEGLVAGYDDAYAEVRNSGGEQAARDWHETNAQRQGERQRRSNRRVALILVAVLVGTGVYLYLSTFGDLF